MESGLLDTGDKLRPPPRWLWYAVLATLVVHLVAARLSVRAIGAPLPGVFIDPFGSFSAVAVPGSPSQSVLRYPDSLQSIDGRPVPDDVSYGAMPADHIRAMITARPRPHDGHINVRFARGSRVLDVRLPLSTVTPRVVAIYFVLYSLAGLLVLWSGAIVLLLSSHRYSAFPVAFLSIASAAFFGTFFDHHSTARLFPAFMLATHGATAGFLWVAYTFPAPPRWHGPRVERLVHAAVISIMAVGLFVASAPILGIDPRPAWQMAGWSTVFASLVLAITLTVRFFRNVADRDELRPALSGFIAVSALSGIGVAIATLTGSTVIHYVFPALIPLLPLSIGWALVRHNILGAHAVLTRRLFVVPVVLLALGAATVAWLALRSLPSGGMDALLSTVVSGGVLGAVAYGLHRLAGRFIFPAAAEFRPTIQQLAENLSELRRRDELRDTLERTVARWLPSGRIRLLDPDALDGIDRLPPDARGRLDAGQKVWTDDTPWDRHLLVPMRSLGELRGVLDISPKHQGALFTEEDLALLDTIAGLGAVALHNADVLAALDETRRIEVDATRDDKRLTLGLLSAELSHEIAHPLQFFRGVLRRSARGALPEDDVEIGGEEIARLERLLASLRSLEPAPMHRAPVAVVKPVARALVLLREALSDKTLTHQVDVAPSTTVLADHDALVQVFANLLRNAAQAAPPRGRVGVSAAPSPDGGLIIDVWDDGPGVPEHLVDTLFHRWVTTHRRDGGSGLGLSVAQKIVYGLGWTLEYLREGHLTRFRITVPAGSVCAEPGERASAAPPEPS